MTASDSHLLVAGVRREGRHQAFSALDPAGLQVSCHQRRRGPYSGVADVLEALVPAACASHPDLVARHHRELVTAAPRLVKQIGQGPRTLVEITPHEERTRYSGRGIIRCTSQGLASFVIEYAHRTHAAPGGPLMLAFDDVDAAEPTAQEFLALLLRRADPAHVQIMLGTAGGEIDEELAMAIASHATVVTAPEVPDAAVPQSADELVRTFIDSDGTTDDPAAIAAYRAHDPVVRARLHDARADRLAEAEDWGLRLGAIPYHREHGSDPAGAGRHALREALEYCVATGFSAATAELGLRGRAVCDPRAHREDYCHFTAKAANALIPLGETEQSLALYRELLRNSDRPQVHMTCSYAIAMLYTRFLSPRDHDRALEWAHTSRALAAAEPDRVERTYFEVFADNGIALIEMHRGNLERALELVDRGIARLEAEVPDNRYVVHRSQLLHNRARALVALGRHEEAHAGFTRLMEWDPIYFEYPSDRASLRRRRGDLDGALRDYDRAIELAPPMPELYFNRATARAQAGQPADALADLDAVLDLDPGFRDAHLTSGTLQLEHGDAEAARICALAGLQLTPNDPRLVCLLADTEHALGSTGQARAAFDRALALDPSFAPALVNRAVLVFELGDADAAILDLTRARELIGDDPNVLHNRGIALQAAGRFRQAITDFTRALDLPNAESADLLNRCAQCHAALSATERASEDTAASR